MRAVYWWYGLEEENRPCQGGGERQEHRVLSLEDLHSWWDGVREVHCDWWVEVVPASPTAGGCNYPNIGMCGGLLA